MRIETIESGTSAAILWAFLWRSILFGGLIGFGVGALIGFAGVLIEMPGLNLLLVPCGLFAGVVTSWLALHQALKRRYRGMRLVLASVDPEALLQPPPDNRL